MSDENKNIVVNVSRSRVEDQLQKEILDMKGALTNALNEQFEAKKALLIEKAKQNDGLWLGDIEATTNLKELTEFEEGLRLVEKERRANAPRAHGTSPDSPPRGSVINANPGYGRNSGPLAKEEFNSAREMIDKVYDTEGPEAEKLKRQLWDRASPMIKKGIRDNVSISGCPRCNCGLTEDTLVCPSCGWDSARAPLIELWKGREA